MEFKKKIDKGLNSLTSSYERARIVSLFVTICSLAYHLGICIFFYFIGVKQMFFYNFVSISVFLFILFLVPRLKSYILPYMLAFAEIVAHQVLADYFLGSYSSFHSFILLLGLLPFIIFENKKKYALPVTFVSSFTYIFFSCRNIEAHAEIPQNVLFVIRCVNITLTVFIIVFVILIYTRVVYRIEY